MTLYKRSFRTSPSPPPQALDLPLRLALERLGPVTARSVWLVPDTADAERLTRSGISRARIWTAQDLEDLPWAAHPVTLGGCLQTWGGGA